MLRKKVKGGLVDPSSSSKALDDEARFRRQYQHLVQDFNDLFKETEAKKNSLDQAKQRKLILYAEVRFLRRRYDELIQLQSAKFAPVKPEPSRNQVAKARRQAQMKSNLSPVIDLNQISNEEEEEEREFQFASEQLRMENHPSKYLVNGRDEEQHQSDLNKSLYRNSGSGSNRSGKRKISWQDQVVLRA